ncbi:MAG: sodium:proton antiporter [Bacteroidetes bacterium GWA2_31_9b]|nr:MAG: sodium:proton antiporter [Bacteroidetes bacterium GWA2_31_9b]
MSDLFKHILHQFNLPLSNPVLIFSLILFIILLSPILLKRLNIPAIIGLIISGVIIGPFGLNILEKNSAIDLFSTIGLLYIMFIAGLELDMNEFKISKNKSFVFGFLTFIFPLSIGFPVCYYLLNFSLNASLLTASMFATHTLVAYPIVSRLGISKNQAVAITVGGTILTDTAVLIILAIIMSNNEGSLNQEFWIKLIISLVIFSFIMFYIIPRITKWFFQKLESEKHAHYIFVLSILFFAAFLAEMAGLEPIIGAFIAGLTLNRLIPHSSALMNRIEFIGNSLFIPFFLISVGMLVDINVIFKGPKALIVAVVLTTVALIGKWIAAFFTQLFFKYSSAQRQLIFGLSSSHAAATLAVILVGYKAGILDENILNGTIILILVTCIIASFATEKAAKKIIITSENSNTQLKGFNFSFNEHILIPVANISNIDKLLNFTLLIKDKKSVNPITILCVVPNNNEAEINIINTRKKLEEFVKHGAASEIRVNTIATIDYNPASGIARISKELMIDILVLGWPKKTGIIDKITGEKFQSIINNLDKNLFFCNLTKPLITHKRIVLLTPPLAEKEASFSVWLKKAFRLSHELTIPIIHFGNQKTQNALKIEIKVKRLSNSISFNDFNDWSDFLVLSRHISDDDLIIFISARKNSFSYMSVLDNIPAKLEKYFSNNNKIVIYPQQFSSYHQNENYEDISSETISKGIEAIEQIGFGIGNIFKKKKNKS